MTGVYIKRGNLDRQVRKEGDEKTQRELPFVSQRERPGIKFSLTALRRSQPCQHIDLSLPASRNVRKSVSAI